MSRNLGKSKSRSGSRSGSRSQSRSREERITPELCDTIDELFYKVYIGVTTANICANNATVLNRMEALVLDCVNDAARKNAKAVGGRGYVARGSESDYSFCPKPLVDKDRLRARARSGIRQRLLQSEQQNVSFIGGGTWRLCYADGVFQPNAAKKAEVKNSTTYLEIEIEEAKIRQATEKQNMVDEEKRLEEKWKLEKERVDEAILADIEAIEAEEKEMKLNYTMRFKELKEGYGSHPEYAKMKEDVEELLEKDVKGLKDKFEDMERVHKKWHEDREEFEEDEEKAYKRAVKDLEKSHQSEEIGWDLKRAILQANLSQQTYLEEPEYRAKAENETAILDLENVLESVRKEIKKEVERDLWKKFKKPTDEMPACFAVEPETAVIVERVLTMSDAVPNEKTCSGETNP